MDPAADGGENLVAALWRWLTCPRAHGWVTYTRDRLWVACPRCGYASPGLEVGGRRERVAWRIDRERARFQRRRAS
jgi:hypothetical protein